MTINTVNDIYAREVVMARVGHLIRRKQREIERIMRMLRGCFDPLRGDACMIVERQAQCCRDAGTGWNQPVPHRNFSWEGALTRRATCASKCRWYAAMVIYHFSVR